MMASRTTLLVLGLLLAIVILTLLDESEARGSRTSSRATSRRSSSRKARKSSPRASNRAPSKPKLAKPKTFHSGVTYHQAQGTKNVHTKRLKIVAATGLAVYLLVKIPPVHTRHYRPYHEASNIVIPKHRALRIAREEYYVQRRDSTSCLNGTLTEYDTENVVNITTKVSYKKAKNVSGSIPSIERSDPKQTNLTISANATDDYVTNLEIRIFFNQSILYANTTQLVLNDTNTTASNGSNATIPMDLRKCTVLVYKAEAYVVELQSYAFKNTASFVLFLLALLVQVFLT